MSDWPKIEDIENDSLTKHDMLSCMLAFVKGIGLVDHNISGFNELITKGINKIMTQQFAINRIITNTRAGEPITHFKINIRFKNAKIGYPTRTVFMANCTELHPTSSRKDGHPYSGAITLEATVELTAIYNNSAPEVKTIHVPTFQIGEFPIMVGSERCITHQMTREALKQCEEDPNDPGGYFIAKRGEYSVDLLENIRYNSMHTHLNMVYNELVRTEFLSQPGGSFSNSSMLTVRYYVSGQLTIEISSTVSSKIALPFYIIYRLFDMCSDIDIAKTIVFDINDKSTITKRILEVLNKAFHLADSAYSGLIYEKNKTAIIEKIGHLISSHAASQKNDSSENFTKYINNEVINSLDKVILPHMGETENSRIKKLRYIGLIIHKTLLVHFGVLSPVDRDSYHNKRVHGAGISLAKTFKTLTNSCLVTPLYKQFRKTLGTNQWSEITENAVFDIFKTVIATNASDLTKGLIQPLVVGNQAVIITGRKVTNNRVSCQLLERKNMLNVYSSERTVVTQTTGNSSKQTKRADLMRRVQSSYSGFICVAQSADSGEKVGMRKQLAMTSSVCSEGETVILKDKLIGEIIPLDKVQSEIMLRDKLARVFVNGEWIGCCKDPHLLVKKFRLMRRKKEGIEPKTTIYHNFTTNEIDFWLDVGRLTRPLFIVDNNIDEYDKMIRSGKKINFVQNIRLTPAHVTKLKQKKLSIDDLLNEGLIEYISPEEQENCYIAESIDELKKNKNNVYNQFTHCDIEQAILGLAALISPYGNHTQPARITHSTNHARQAGGWYAFNYPYRTDKNRFFQFYNEMPLVKTVVYDLLPSNGMNVIIAYASYGGDNQEDSAIVSQASVDRGLFNGVMFKTEIVELKKGELFTTPDATITKGLKQGVNYAKLENGFIRKGSVVRLGDVMVGRVEKINKQNSDTSIYQYIDKSVVYKPDEPAIIDDVLRLRGVDDQEFCVVKLRYERPLRTGDKLASRCGNKSIVATLLSESDMPFTEDGLKPDIIINPHSFPTRMTIGQLIETTMGKICAKKGIITDGTSFLPIDHYKIMEELVELGFRYNGQERMYNGKTGEYFDTSIFIGPNLEQRIQKFVLDDEQVVAGSGPTDPTTGQPLGGKHLQGGLKIGEMEEWAICSHGAMFNSYEKLSTDSDGRKMYICRNCGNFAVFNEYHNIYLCKICNEYADIVEIDGSKSAQLVIEELAASNIGIKFEVTPRVFEE